MSWELKREWIEHLRDEKKKAIRTCETYQTSLERLEIFCGKECQDLTSKDARRFRISPDAVDRSGKPYKSKTRNHTIAAFKSFHKWGVGEEYWLLDPAILLLEALPTDDEEHIPPLLLERAQELLRWTDSADEPQYYRAVHLGLYAGLRASECASISYREWKDPEVIKLVAGKGNKPRAIPAHRELQRVREEIISSNTLGRTGIQYIVSKIRKGMNVDWYWTHHCLRKTIAHYFFNLEPPGNLLAIQDILGHEDEGGGDQRVSSTTRLYMGKTSMKRMRAEMDRLDYFNDEMRGLW